jgi:hypothetical protein
LIAGFAAAFVKCAANIAEADDSNFHKDRLSNLNEGVTLQ